MKILIIGNTSFIAKYLRKNLSKFYDVKLAGRQEDPDLLFSLEGGDNIPQGEKFDIIIHCAGSFYDDSLDGFMKNEKTNSMGAIHVINLAKKCNCRHLIYCNTISGYNNSKNEYFGSYGLSKKHGGELLEILCRKNKIEYTNLLLTQLYDAKGLAEKHQPSLYNMIKEAANNKDIIIYGKSNPKRNFLFIDDLVKIFDLIIKNKVYGKYPCVSSESLSMTEVAECVVSVFGKTNRIVRNMAGNKIKSIYIPRGRALWDKLNYIPETSFVDGLNKIKNTLYKKEE